ncbi:MAG: DNA polymerase III subunit beta [Bacteriovoracales bacterium]|nr:DNA polymerase III subunit beta [Bacteriovoracales bacterium]
MRLSVKTQDLKNALSQTLSIVDRKNPRAILTYVLFSAKKDGSIALEATDLEISNRIVCQAKVDEGGTFCVHPRNLFDLIREISHDTLHLETVQDHKLLKLTSDHIDISLLICSSEEFPPLSFGEGLDEFELNGDEILHFINKTSYAISHDETRLFLNGIFLQQKDSKLRAVATNGYTFALTESDSISASHENLDKGIIIPKKGVSELKKLAEQNSSSPIKISVNESFMFIKIEEKCLLSIRLIARDYPPYQTVIPSQTSYSMTISRLNLLNAIRRVKVLANERSNAIKFSLGQDELTVSANHPELGEASEKLQMSNFEGEAMDIGFNAKYMMDSLSVLGDDDVTFEFNNSMSPVVVKSIKNKEFLGMVMPLKL